MWKSIVKIIVIITIKIKINVTQSLKGLDLRKIIVQ